MSRLLLFTDGSVNVQTNVGYGACLLISEDQLSNADLGLQVKVKRFENTSSTKLELQTLLWALEEVGGKNKKIVVYTDSQNILQLLERRQRLEGNNFQSKKGIVLKNAELYVLFYQLIDLCDCEIIKVKGHQPSRKKDEIEHIFTLVDRASRKALRNSE